MIGNAQYIKNVNRAVKEGRHNRKIIVVYQENRPTVGGKKGTASLQTYRKYDRISVWKHLPDNNKEKKFIEEKIKKETGRTVNIPTKAQVIRHELWHIHKPYASEKQVRMSLEKKKLPNSLPPRRRFKS